MGKKDAIKVNGMMLDEYLRDMEDIETEIEERRIKKEISDTFNVYRPIKHKYKDYKEKNGKVKTLGIRELNKEKYESKLNNAVVRRDIIEAFVVIIICLEEKPDYSASEISDIIEKKAKELNVKFKLGVSNSLRVRIGILKRRKIWKYIKYIERRGTGDGYRSSRYGIKDEYKENLSIEDAIDMSKISSNININIKEDVEKRINDDIMKIESTDKENNLLQHGDDDRKIGFLDTFVEKLKSAVVTKDSNGGITFTGDINIHIHINNK